MIDKTSIPRCSGADDSSFGKDQFIDSLPEEDMQLRIRQSRPANLRQALKTALELESYIVASKRVKSVREVPLEESSARPEDECSEAKML